MEFNYKIIAVDFDGTLCSDKWPQIGAANTALFSYLLEQREKGCKLILWTNRVGDCLEEAVAWCNKNGLIFDAVNENLQDVIDAFGFDSRKVFAHEYIDDRMVDDFDLPFMKAVNKWQG